MDNLAASGFALVALGYAAFATFTWRTGLLALRVWGAPSLLFIGALVLSAGWAACEAASFWGLRALAWPVSAAVLDALRYGAWMGFLGALIRSSEPVRGAAWMRSMWATGALVLCAVLVRLAWLAAEGDIDAPPERMDLLLLLALPLLGVLFLEQVFRSLGDMMWHIKPACLGLGLNFAFDIYMLSEAFLFGRYDVDTLRARPVVHILALVFLLMSAQRRPDWMTQFRMSRRAAFHSATLLLAGGYLVAVSTAAYSLRYFGGSWSGSLQIMVLFASAAGLAALLVSGSLRARLKVFVGKHFFSYRYDYREEWLRFTGMLTTQGSPEQVGIKVLNGLAELVECTAGSLWLKREGDDRFSESTFWNLESQPASEGADSPFAGYLKRTGWVLDLEEFRVNPGLYSDLELPAWLIGTEGVRLVVPLLVGDELVGWVLLAKERTSIDINWEVLDLLKTAGRQAAGYLAQMQATEALMEARKFDTFNRMSAFVVHDLKNIVSQLSLMAKNAKRLRDNPEFQEDMVLTVEAAAEKMRRLILQLREGAAPAGGAAGVPLAPIVQRLQSAARARGRALEVQLDSSPATRGHEERLERVLGHLVDNALDATPATGRVWVVVARHSGQVRVEVGDTGAGMDEEFVRTRLFRPFSSTKATGMGVGSYESAQYIKELGGTLEVRSKPGQGTVITVLLPIFEGSQKPGLQLGTGS